MRCVVDDVVVVGRVFGFDAIAACHIVELLVECLLFFFEFVSNFCNVVIDVIGDARSRAIFDFGDALDVVFELIGVL